MRCYFVSYHRCLFDRNRAALYTIAIYDRLFTAEWRHKSTFLICKWPPFVLTIKMFDWLITLFGCINAYMHFICYKIFYGRNVFSWFLYIQVFIIVNRCSNMKQRGWGALVLVASNVIKTSHARALNSIILEQRITINFIFTSLSIVF